MVFDTETGVSCAVDNSRNASTAHGAGIQTAEKVAELGVHAVIAEHVGPKAFDALQAGGIRVYTGATGTVAFAVEQLEATSFRQRTAADVEEHWA
jgi:predicted Fe-Mo cluster-binding NifX family protein